MERPSNKRIAVSVVLAIAGAILLAFPWIVPTSFFMKLAATFSHYNDWIGWVLLAMALVGSAMIVGAIGDLFRHPWVGALCGVSLYFTVCVIRAVFFVHIQ